MTSYEFTLGEALRALDLVRDIAEMTKDGEFHEDGEECTIENDDAWETVMSLISAAREIVRHAT